MKSNPSTASQRSFIEALAKGKSISDLEIMLAPAFKINSNKFSVMSTLNQNLSRLTVTAASECISILKAAK